MALTNEKVKGPLTPVPVHAGFSYMPKPVRLWTLWYDYAESAGNYGLFYYFVPQKGF